MKSFKDVLLEGAFASPKNNVVVFFFYDGKIPDIEDPENVLDFDEWLEKYRDRYKKVDISDCQLGIRMEFTVPSKIPYRAIFVPDIYEMITSDPQGVYSLWKDLIRRYG